MAMTPSSGQRSIDLNVTPMIDILLVLIIIMMVMPGLERKRGERAEIPQPPTTNTHKTDEGQIVLELQGSDERPSLLLNREEVSWPELERRLRQVYAARSLRVLFVKADETLFFDSVAQAISAAHAAVPGVRVALMSSDRRS